MKKILPREKALLSGIRSLNDDELLAIILSTGTKNKNVFVLASDILREFSPNELADMPIKVLSKIEGIGKVKATRLAASFELGRRVYLKEEKPFDEKHLKFILYEISYSKKEQLLLIMYDGGGFHIKTEVIGVGSFNVVMVHPREIFEPLFKYGANQFILAHNHPDGDCNPSDDDVRMTEEIKDISSRLDINFIESFVVAKGRAYGIINGITLEI